MSFRFDTTGQRPEHRFEYWREQVCRTFVGLDIDAPVRQPFFGSLSSREAGRCLLVRAEGSAVSVARTDRWIRQDEARCAVVMMQRAGRATVVQDGRRTPLAPGGLVMIDTRRPYRLEFHAPFVQDVVKAPTELLERRLPTANAMAARDVGTATPAGRMLAAALDAAATGGAPADGPATGGPGGFARLESTLVDLIAIALGSAGGCDASDPAAPVRVRRARAYILHRLHDPALRAEDVANDQGVSPRLLQRLFAAEGTTVSSWILEQRLLRAHRALQDVPATARIGDVAARHGFSDATTFGRAFRRRFGLRPTDVRIEGSSGVDPVRTGSTPPRR